MTVVVSVKTGAGPTEHKELVRALIRDLILEAMKNNREMFVQDLIGRIFSSSRLREIGYTPKTLEIHEVLQEMSNEGLIKTVKQYECECCKGKKISPEEAMRHVISIRLRNQGN